MVEAIGLALAGRAGARLAALRGIDTSRDSLLRLIRALPDPPVGTVEVLGLDDFAIARSIWSKSAPRACSRSGWTTTPE